MPFVNEAGASVEKEKETMVEKQIKGREREREGTRLQETERLNSTVLVIMH